MKFVGAVAVAALLSGSVAIQPPDLANAAMRGDIAQVEALLKAGADVNAAQGDGMTALHWAAERGDARMADMLIRGGASVKAITWIGEYTPLHLASKGGSPEVISLLLNAGSDVKARTTNSGATALHLAAASGSAQSVTLLLDRGAEVDAREAAWQQTPLMFAAALNRADVIRVLLARGADPKLRSWTVDGATRAADQMAATVRGDVLKAFQAGATAGVTPKDVQTAITAGRQARSRATGSSDFVATAPDPTRDPDDPPPNNAITPGGLTALHHAARQGHVEAVKALIEGGADVNELSAVDGWTPLLIATTNGQWDAAMLLIEAGANPNTANQQAGIAPLWSTINARWQPRPSFPQPQEQDFQQHSYLEVMEALLVNGADPDAKNTAQPFYLFYGGCGNANCGLTQHSGFTAFFRAGLGADVEAMRLLVKYGADPTITRTPQAQGGGGGGRGGAPDPTAAAVAAAAAGRAAGAGPGRAAAPEPVPTAPASAIHAASGLGFGQGVGAGNAIRFMQNGWLPAVKYLVEELGFDVNARDDGGFTPLHFAAARGDTDLIMYLIEKGANVKARSAPDARNGFPNGYTVADMANGPQPRITPMPATVELLVKLGSENSNNCRSCQ
jgi:ankyrin repeat protein